MIKDEINLNLKEIYEKQKQAKEKELSEEQKAIRKTMIGSELLPEIKKIASKHHLRINKHLGGNHKHAYFYLYENWYWEDKVDIHIHINIISIRIKDQNWYPCALEIAEMIKTHGYSSIIRWFK